MISRYEGETGNSYSKASTSTILNHTKGKTIAFVAVNDMILIPAGTKNSLDVEMDVNAMTPDDYADFLVGVWTGKTIL